MIDIYYDTVHGVLKNKLNIVDHNKLAEAENYCFAQNFRGLKSNFSYDPEYISHLNQKLFESIYTWAGQYRCIDIEKSEDVLAGLSVQYSHFGEIENNIIKALLNFKQVKFNDLAPEEKANYITDIVVKLWQVHPFRDCNTRTLVTYIYKYCESNKVDFNVHLLIQNMDYFRKSLVASAFEDKVLGVEPNKQYTLKIMRNAINKS